MNEKRIGEVAKFLDVTPATIRNWVKLYGDEYLSPRATNVTGKRFTPADVATLGEIHRLLREGLRYDEIPGKLQAIPVIIDDQPGSQGVFDIPDPTIAREYATSLLSSSIVLWN